ncbi:LysE family transporter [Alicyclobacillus sp.]|uniref:LysE/ArgO family amino acid transporter n=1 Tax=Alicyclobacillus sp. TaxID=61169 RepID=UPI0025C0430D|nr:LysE family transporter [Alicyclobacillus sp.]MCL6517226.1 LysE family transporter [Alicyclobacillus sp.]
MVIAFLHGFLLSFGLILPIGMQNGFILTQGALHRRWAGALPSVLTAAVCDTLLIALAVWGVSAIVLEVRWLRYTFGAIGIVFLLYMGISAWRENPGQNESAAITAWTVRRQMVFTASVSLLNPHAIMDTLAVIGGSAAAYSAWPERIAFGVASALVSWLWFFGLSLAGHLAGRSLASRSSLRLLNRVSAVVMLASALYLAHIIYRS